MGRRIVLAVALAALSGASCAHVAIARALTPPAGLECRDGAPIRVLVDRACERGVCGWTCAPGRWEADTVEH